MSIWPLLLCSNVTRHLHLSKTHISFLLEVFLNAESDSLQSCLPLLRSLVQLSLQPLNVLQHQQQPTETINATYDTRTNRIKLEIKVSFTNSYSEEFGDSIRLGSAHAAVTRPNDPPLTVGDGVRFLWALQPHSHHPPVVTWPRGQSLICEEVPFTQAGDADRRLQDHLQNRKGIEWESGALHQIPWKKKILDTICNGQTVWNNNLCGVFPTSLFSSMNLSESFVLVSGLADCTQCLKMQNQAPLVDLHTAGVKQETWDIFNIEDLLSLQNKTVISNRQLLY